MTCDAIQVKLQTQVNGGLVKITDDALLAKTAGSKYADRRAK
jgi:hypothetical protein